jgi:restriction endonuclease Mrr
LYNPVLQALHDLDGYGARHEILYRVREILDLTDEQMAISWNSDEGSKSAVENRAGFALTHLKRAGLVENPSRGVWALTEDGRNTYQVSPKDVRRTAEQVRKRERRLEYEESSFDQPETVEAEVPTLDKLLNPLLQVYHRLGGSGTNDAVYDEIIKQLELTDRQLSVLHNPDGGLQTEVAYRLTVARSYLRKYGLLDTEKPKHWALTEEGKSVEKVNPYAVMLYYLHRSWEEGVQRQQSLLTDLQDVDATFRW